MRLAGGPNPLCPSPLDHPLEHHAMLAPTAVILHDRDAELIGDPEEVHADRAMERDRCVVRGRRHRLELRVAAGLHLLREVRVELPGKALLTIRTPDPEKMDVSGPRIVRAE